MEHDPKTVPEDDTDDDDLTTPEVERDAEITKPDSPPEDEVDKPDPNLDNPAAPA